MKKNISAIFGAVMAILLFVIAAHSALHKNATFIAGRTLTIWSSGTNNNTWYATNAYSTNIILTNYQNVGVNPGGTNYSTSTNAGVITTNYINIVPGWEIDIPNWADANGAVNPNAVLAITYTGNSVYTNGTTITLVHSVDSTNFDLVNNTFSFGFTNASPYTNTTTVITNLPTVFLQGVSRIRLHSITIATNGVTGANITFNTMSLSGFVP